MADFQTVQARARADTLEALENTLNFWNLPIEDQKVLYKPLVSGKLAEQIQLVR